MAVGAAGRARGAADVALTAPAETWTALPSRPVRSLDTGTPGVLPDLVLVPGLGALGYLRPAVSACAAWTRVRLLDLPGFGHPDTADCPASLDDVVDALADWLERAAGRPVLLVGHSTGAQAALHAALRVPDTVAALVLSGVTFPPAARRPAPLLGRVARTVVHERPRELPAVLPEYLRAGRRLVPLVSSALRDRPEDHVGAVRVPVVVARGVHDALCDRPWAQQLAARARQGTLVVLPGAHNTPTTHPAQTAAAWRRALGPAAAG